jgi:signal transduction histidine kinase/CheY-like chemotaxis protein
MVAAATGSTGERRGWRAGFGVPAILAQMFAPPPRFDPLLEAVYRGEMTRRWATARHAALVLLALIWVSYFGWDWFHSQRNAEFGAAFGAIAALRLAGALCIAAMAAAVIARGREPRTVAIASASGLAILYLLSLAMIAVTDFPYNYLFYFICLPMIMLFMFGLFRLDSRIVYQLTAFFLLASIAFLVFAQTTETSSPKSLVEFLSKTLSYYNVAALIFLLTFSLVGCAVAVQLERSARDAFGRERQLTDRNKRLEAAQEETRIKTDALVKAKDELRALAERQNVAKSKFLADAAHDLRQPMQALTNLLGAARHALDQGDSARCDEMLSLAQDASRLTRNSFNAVLDISRLESGFVQAEPVDFDLTGMLEEALAPLLPVAAEQDVDIRFRWRRDRPIAVHSDPHLLGRVVGNLVANGIKYSEPARENGPGVLVGVVCLPGRVRIDVVDNGVGIPQADWAKVFNPFVQLGNSERDREKGVGLGLSIVNAIIPLLPEHRLDMRSREGVGTRFSLELPYSRAAASTVPRHEPTRPPGPMDLSGFYILYVEDDAMVRRSATALFDTLDMRYEAYASYDDLAAAVPELERIPDLLITDFRLPDGRTAKDVVQLTSEAFDTVLPLIVITGEMQAFEEGDWIGEGRILRKPVSSESLIAEISAQCLAIALAEGSRSPAATPR